SKKDILPASMRRAKIVCTLGPASKEPTFIGNLIDEGMNVARINFSHGDAKDHEAAIAAVRSEAQKRGRAVAVLQDLQGPKIRVGRFVTGAIELEPGADFTLTTRDVPGTHEIASTTYAGLPRDVKPVPIISKIEKPEVIDYLEAIIDRSDGIMVARGDLGVEMGAEKVPLIQKRAIKLTNAKGKVVITATQMLESIITNARPTRAEASDVANAVLDGSDALMLSGETASGKYPLLAVRTMARIIEEIEASARFKSRFDAATLDFATSANTIAKAAVVASRQMGASAIACVTESGGVARLVSEYRPEARLAVFSSQQDVYRRLALYWGVEPVMAPVSRSFDALIVDIERRLVEGKFAKGGELVVMVVAVPIGAGQSANTLHIHKISG